jgi:hypothetical protein
MQWVLSLTPQRDEYVRDDGRTAIERLAESIHNAPQQTGAHTHTSCQSQHANSGSRQQALHSRERHQHDFAIAKADNLADDSLALLSHHLAVSS